MTMMLARIGMIAAFLSMGISKSIQQVTTEGTDGCALVQFIFNSHSVLVQSRSSTSSSREIGASD